MGRKPHHSIKVSETRSPHKSINNYNQKNIERIGFSRYNNLRYNNYFNNLNNYKKGEDYLKNMEDWFPSHPYSVIIDNKRFCANIKIKEDYVHFHLVCGYNPYNENPGSEDMYKSYKNHLIINKKNIAVVIKGSITFYYVKTNPQDWSRFYRFKDKESNHFFKGYKPIWDPYNWYVDWKLEINKGKLKKIGKSQYKKSRSEGEKMIANALRELNLRYIPEYFLDNLEYDSKKYRLIDFYLPKEDIYIEFNGGVNAFGDEKRKNELARYAEKEIVLKKNNLRVINLYPQDLARTQYMISEGVSKYIKYGSFENEDKNIDNGRIIVGLQETLEELKITLEKEKEKRLKNRLKNIYNKGKDLINKYKENKLS
jgi:hypothetical protein